MNNFTFPNPAHKNTAEAEYDSWSEKIKSHQNPFGKENAVKFGAWTRKIRCNSEEDDDDSSSSTPSPELWEKTQLPPKPKCSYNIIVSPNNSMMRYRKEMMGLVKDMPEAGYELSLRDMVEPPTVLTPLKEEKRKDGREMKRSESLDSALLSMKKLIPSFLMGGRKKSRGKNGSVGAKVTPKPALTDGDKSGSEKSVDKEWWNEDFGGSRGSCSSSGRSKNARRPSGCYPMFQARF